ncbi:MAG: hypothetical protein HN686_13395 [Bacteroidetes bacterium]|jgi:Tol biopolymer transport system component|nr:hypothetical protein [Bacteroidota bacterium]MBT4411395.1 hypothetical protein [Bacteroidota bacterium]MBT7464978.1 hypothetical protein [Bacteroidota bacterium]
MKRFSAIYCISLLSLFTLAACSAQDVIDFETMQSNYVGSYFGQKPPGEKPEKFAPRLFTFETGYHSAVSFSMDGTEAVWSLNQGKKCTMYSKMEDQVWSVPVEVDFGLKDGIIDPIFSPDGNRLYFISRQAPQMGQPERDRIWFVSRTNDGWSDPQPIDDVVTAHATHWTFSFADNGNLYFTSEMPAARGGQDIWMSVFDGEKYLTPVDLGEAINSDFREMTPCIAPDERFLIFSRSRDMADLYISYKNPDGTWANATKMKSGMNTLHHDICPVLSPDGKYLFFARKFRMYWVDAKAIKMN